jgi:hypothetical protein
MEQHNCESDSHSRKTLKNRHAGDLAKIGLVLISGAFLFWCRYVWFTPQNSADFIRYIGYWFMLVMVVAASVYAIKNLGFKRNFKELLNTHKVAFIIAIVGAIFLHLHEPQRFKILFDEYAYSGIAYDMHFERQASYPSRAHFFEDRLNIMSHGVDKRPVLFPFLISVLHDLTGYRVENVFYLNAVLSAVLLLLIYGCCLYLSNKEVAWLGQLLVLTIPLLAQNATGGGYEILNMVLVCSLFLASASFLKRRGTDGLDLMILIALLLAQVRYESILFVFIPAGLAIYKWIVERKISLTWLSAISPFGLCIPMAVNHVSMSFSVYFENKPGVPFFSGNYFVPNIEKAVYYLFNPSLWMTNSLVLSLLGIVSLVLCLVKIFGIFVKKAESSQQDILMLSFSIVIGVNLCIIMLNFWAGWDDPMTSRFSFSLQLLFVFATAYILGLMKVLRTSLVLRSTFAVLLVALSVPSSAKAAATHNMIPGGEYDWFFREIAKRQRPEDILLVGPGFIAGVLYGYPSVTSAAIDAAPWKVKLCLADGVYKEIIVLERILIDPKTLKEDSENLAMISNDFVLERIAEKRFRPDIITRISKIVDFRGAKGAPPEDFLKKGPPFKNNYEYVMSFVEKLP